jgi:hypothetical protein
MEAPPVPVLGAKVKVVSMFMVRMYDPSVQIAIGPVQWKE